MDLLAKSCLPQVLQVLRLQSLACLHDMFCVWNGMMFCVDMLDILAEFVLPFRLGATVSSFNPKTSIWIQKCHPYTGNLNSKMSGDSTNAFQYCEDVLVVVECSCHEAIANHFCLVFASEL